MSGTEWFQAVWTIVNLAMFFINCLMLVIGGLRREREYRIMHREWGRQVLGALWRRRLRWAKAQQQVLMEDDMAAIRQERERARR